MINGMDRRLRQLEDRIGTTDRPRIHFLLVQHGETEAQALEKFPEPIGNGDVCFIMTLPAAEGEE